MASLIHKVREAGKGESKWLSWLAAISLGVYSILCVGPWASGRWRAEWDSALYLETGRSLASGEGYTYLGEPFYLRPPGLSWLLSLTMGENGELNLALANRLLMACAAGAIIALFFLLRRRFGTLMALAVALLTGTSELYVKQFNYILSEFPYLVVCFLGMALTATWGKLPARSLKLSLLQVPLLVGAFYLRSQALLLLPGIFILECHKRGLKKALLPCVLIAGATLPWMMHASNLAAAAPSPSIQFKLHDYNTALFRTNPGDPNSERVSMAGWIERIQSNGEGLLNNALDAVHLPRISTFVKEADGSRTTTWSPIGIATGILLTLATLAGFLLLMRTGWTLFEWFVLGNTALILVYFTFAPRLAMPLVPALYLYLLALPLALGRIRWQWLAQCTANLLAIVLLSANIAGLADNAKEPARIKILRRDINAMATWARENTPEDAVLLCKQGPMVGAKSNRRTYSSRFESDPGMLNRYQIDYIICFGPGTDRLEQEALRRGGERWEIIGSTRIVAYRIPGD